MEAQQCVPLDDALSRLLGADAGGDFAPLRTRRREDFPSRPVHLIVPYAGGGSGDLLARLLGDKLSKFGASRSWSKTSPAPAD